MSIIIDEKWIIAENAADSLASRIKEAVESFDFEELHDLSSRIFGDDDYDVKTLAEYLEKL